MQKEVFSDATFGLSVETTAACTLGNTAVYARAAYTRTSRHHLQSNLIILGDSGLGTAASSVMLEAGYCC